MMIAMNKHDRLSRVQTFSPCFTSIVGCGLDAVSGPLVPRARNCAGGASDAIAPVLGVKRILVQAPRGGSWKLLGAIWVQ